MTPPDPFETRLAATPRAGLPPELRGRILAAARERAPRALAALLWPHPVAWGAVAAAWVAIAVLNFSGPRGPELYAVSPKEYRGRLPSAQEYLVRLETERRLLLALAAEQPLPLRAHRPFGLPRPQDL